MDNIKTLEYTKLLLSNNDYDFEDQFANEKDKDLFIDNLMKNKNVLKEFVSYDFMVFCYLI